MRSFISLNINREIKEEFRKIQNNVRENIGVEQREHIKWEKKDKFHMTVFFLGDVPDKKIKELSNELDTVKLFPSIDTTGEILFAANNINAFPNLKYPRVLIIELTNEDGRVFELCEKIQKVLLHNGYNPDKKFHPHITLGRIKRNQKINLFELKDRIKFNVNFSISSFYLMESRLDYRGSVYKKIKKIPF
jgi:2'-5' RNA ligase